ncbi:MAG: penicillin-binding protein 2 [Gammaproteobacteria bacterium]|nr:penicillin-binding protein 2 [Gammaproteobacteria bacterium]
MITAKRIGKLSASSPARRSKHFILKNILGEIRLFNDRIIVAWLAIVVLTLVLAGRLFFLQVLSHEHFTTLSEKNRIKILPLPPTRGLIYDRNGVILADNQPSHNLEIVPEQVEEDMGALLARLRTIIAITDKDAARFERFLKQKRRFEKVPLRFRLTEQEVARFSVRQYRFSGVHITSSLSRHYPLGAHAVHAIGYVGRINARELNRIDTSNYSGTYYIGKTGMEKFYEKQLHGTTGLQKVETNVQGRILRVLERTLPVPGKNLYLNLDSNVQKQAEKMLAGKRGALVAVEPGSGAVLALASMPVYDPNLFVNGVDPAAYRELLASSDRPLFNRVTRGQYPPGSTIKPFVGLAGIVHGFRTLTQETWCPGWYSLANKKHKYRDWKRLGHKAMNFHHAVVQSCDVYFYDLAYDLGIDRLSEFLGRFGFGRKTGIDIGGEAKGLMPTRKWKSQKYDASWYPGETLISGIGQGFTLATPLQLAMAAAAMATKGQTRQPRVVFTIDEVTKNGMQLVRATPLTNVSLPAAYWEAAHAAMEAVVHSPHGTARGQRIHTMFRIAGKTGTAQVFGIKQDQEYDEEKLAERLRDHALFIGFAPAERPKIAVAVIVENGGTGSSAAAPIARRVIEFYLTEHFEFGEHFEIKGQDDYYFDIKEYKDEGNKAAL